MPTIDAVIAEGRPRWDALSELVRKAHGRPERLGAEGVLELAGLYRQASADLALLRRRLPGDPLLAPLEALVGQARLLVYEAPRRRDPGALARFLGRGYWQLVRQDQWALWLAIALTAGPILLGWLWGLADPGRAAAFTPGLYDGITQPRPHGADLGLPVAQRGDLASSIFTHNILIAFLALAGGMTGGLLTAYLLLTNALTVGVVGGLSEGTGNMSLFVQLILPHGLLEISAVTVAASAGFRLAGAFVRPGDLSRSEALAARAPQIARLAVGTALWLVPAGLTEGFFTPAGFGAGPSLAMGLGLFSLYWGLVVLRGGPDRRARGGATGAVDAGDRLVRGAGDGPGPDRSRPPPRAAVGAGG